MTKLNVYLNFAGNTEEAFKFYKSVFGGDFEDLDRFKNMPRKSGKVNKDEENKILSITLPVNGNDLMASDTLGSRGQRLVQGNNFYISITPDSKRDADRIFKRLSEDGRPILPISDQPWQAYYGSLVDKFGIRWMVNYVYPKAEVKTRHAKARPALKAKSKAGAKPASIRSKLKAAPVKVKSGQKQKIRTKPAVPKKKKIFRRLKENH